MRKEMKVHLRKMHGEKLPATEEPISAQSLQEMGLIDSPDGSHYQKAEGEHINLLLTYKKNMLFLKKIITINSFQLNVPSAMSTSPVYIVIQRNVPEEYQRTC